MATVTDTAARDRWEKENAAAPPREQPPTTVSSVPIDAAVHAGQPRRLRPRHRPRLSRPVSVHARRPCHACTAAGSGPCGSSPASARRGRPTSASTSCSTRARPASAPPSTCRRSWASTATIRARSAKSAGSASPSIRSTTWRELFDGIDLAEVSVSMTINAPAIVVMAFFLANAQDRGVDWKQLRGTIQNDILKEFHAQNEFVFPPEPHVRLVADVIEFCTQHVPQWNTVSASAATTSARPARPPCRNWPSRWPTASTTSTPAWHAAWTSTPSRRGSASSSTPTTTSSRRSPSTGRPACCGPRRMRQQVRRPQGELVEAALPRPDGRLLACRTSSRKST